MKEMRSKTVPRPPVILAIISFPQRIKPVATPIINKRSTITIIKTTLRFLWGFGGLSFVFGDVSAVDFSLGFSSPVDSSKSKAWTGLRKSSTGLTFGALTGFLGFGLETFVLLADFVGFEALVITEDFGLVADVFDFGGTLLEAAEILECFGVSPSIDLFFSIFYNYSICA